MERTRDVRHPGRAERAAVALVLGVAAAIFVLIYARHGVPSDLDQVLVGARLLLHHRDPYAAIGPGRAFEWPWPLYYPATALLVVLPLAPLPIIVGRAIFFGLSCAALAYVLTRDGWHRLPLFLSAPFLRAAMLVQWSPLVTAAALLPALGWLLLAAKPNIGLALWVAFPERIALAGAAVLGALSLVLYPSWPSDWLNALDGAPAFHAPITLAVGMPLGLAVLRWRRPEARLLLAMACVPQTPLVYETVPLFLVPRTLRQALVLSLLADVASWAVYFQRFADYNAFIAEAARWTTALVYVPCLVMILRRPNCGSVPPCVERFAEGVSHRLRFARRPTSVDESDRALSVKSS